MANDFKQVNDRSINDINRANRDAWDSGEFKHSSDSPEYQVRLKHKETGKMETHQVSASKVGIAKEVGEALAKKTGHTHVSTSPLDPSGKSYGGRTYKPIATHKHEDAGLSPQAHAANVAASDPFQHGSEGRLQAAGKKALSGKKTSPEEKNMMRGALGYKSSKSTLPKGLKGDAEDVRHPKTGGQQVVGEGGKVIVHAHDEGDPMREKREGEESSAPEKAAYAKEHYSRSKKLLEKEVKPAETRHPVIAPVKPALRSNDTEDAVHLPRTRKKTWRKSEWS